MITIHSFVQAKKQTDLELTTIAKQADLSLHFLKKHKYTTILYTTKELKNTIFLNLKYDNIIEFDSDQIDLINKFSEYKFWSAAKLIACESTKEPFLHIDMDLFLYENILKDKINYDFTMFHIEPFMTKLYSRINNITLFNDFDICPTDQISNCAIFGGNNYKKIGYNINKILQLSYCKDTIINKLLSCIKERNNDCWKKSVFIEQLWLCSSIKKTLDNKNVNYILNCSDAKNHSDIFKILQSIGVLHLWIGKNNINNYVGLNTFLDMIKNYHK